MLKNSQAIWSLANAPEDTFNSLHTTIHLTVTTACLSLKNLPNLKLRRWVWVCLLQSEKKPIMHQNDASALSPSFFVVGQSFLYLTFPLLLRLAVYIYHVFPNMPPKWTAQIAPGNKFLSLSGSQCARTHHEDNQNQWHQRRTKFKKKIINVTVNQ